eukprot:2593076-Prymnesium_polylepis.1
MEPFLRRTNGPLVAKGANLNGSLGRVGRHATSAWHESHQRRRGACVGVGEPLLGRDPGSFGALAAFALQFIPRDLSLLSWPSAPSSRLSELPRLPEVRRSGERLAWSPASRA